MCGHCGAQDDWLEVAPQALPLAEQAPFQPAAAPRAVTFAALCPSALLDEARLFLQVRAMHATWQAAAFQLSGCLTCGHAFLAAASRRSAPQAGSDLRVPRAGPGQPCALERPCQRRLPVRGGSRRGWQRARRWRVWHARHARRMQALAAELARGADDRASTVRQRSRPAARSARRQGFSGLDGMQAHKGRAGRPFCGRVRGLPVQTPSCACAGAAGLRADAVLVQCCRMPAGARILADTWRRRRG